MITVRIQRFAPKSMISKPLTLNGPLVMILAAAVFLLGCGVTALGLGAFDREPVNISEPRSDPSEHRGLLVQAEQLAERARILESANTKDVARITTSLWKARAKIAAVSKILGVEHSADLEARGEPDDSLKNASDAAFATLAAQADSLVAQAEIIGRKALAKVEAEQMKIGGKPVDSGWLSSRYGWREDPFTSKRTWHNGIDFAARKGTIVRSLGPGIVVKAEFDGGFGNVVEVEHPTGIVSRYAHNQALSVEVGDIVSGHQAIATVGSTGRSTGYHLHLEMIDGDQSLNPEDVIGIKRDILLSAGPTQSPADG